MKPEGIIEKIVSSFEGIFPKSSWGETSLFYAPGKLLPNGIYFCTIKEKDGDNDKACNLDHDGVFRLSVGISKDSYEAQFGAKSKRPSKGCIIDTDHDFTELNRLMPHPFYGWMSCIQVLNSTEVTFGDAFLLIAEAHSNVIDKFNKKTANQEGQADALTRISLS